MSKTLEARRNDWSTALRSREADEQRRVKQQAKARSRRVAHRGQADAHDYVKRHNQAKRRLRHTRHSIRDAERAIAKIDAQIARRGGSRDKALAKAKANLGIVENTGSNRGTRLDPLQRRYGFLGVPWCGIYCLDNARAAGVQANSRWAAVAFIEDDARAGRNGLRAWTTDPGRVKPGDLVVLFGRGVHVGMVERVANGVIYTLEGNTSSGNGGSQSNGGGSYRRVRPMSAVHGFALVNYS